MKFLHEKVQDGSDGASYFPRAKAEQYLQHFLNFFFKLVILKFFKFFFIEGNSLTAEKDPILGYFNRELNQRPSYSLKTW